MESHVCLCSFASTVIFVYYHNDGLKTVLSSCKIIGIYIYIYIYHWHLDFASRKKIQ